MDVASYEADKNCTGCANKKNKIKNNPLAKMLDFSHGSSNLRQICRLCMRIFTLHVLKILLK